MVGTIDSGILFILVLTALLGVKRCYESLVNVVASLLFKSWALRLTLTLSVLIKEFKTGSDRAYTEELFREMHII